MQKQSHLHNLQTCGSRDRALSGRFDGLLYALVTLPQVKIPNYPTCLDIWRREKSLLQLDMDRDSSVTILTELSQLFTHYV